MGYSRFMSRLGAILSPRRFAVAALVSSAALGGCVVESAPGPGPRAYAPAGYVAASAYAPPPNVVYVRPAYASPGAGYIWRYHRRFGWGWWHPHYGWHRGWEAE